MASDDQKLKLVHLIRILEEETDDEHGLTGPQLIAALAERGVAVERKTLYRDLEALRHAGYDVQKYQRSPVEYGLATRRFQQQELLLLVDAVQSSRFLTQRKADALIVQIGRLTSRHMADELARQVHVEGRIKMQNESVYYHLDAIQRAMRLRRKIEFRYFKHNERKEPVLQHGGELYVETPVHLVYTGDCYYAVVWNDKHENFANYRIDRMLELRVSKEEATCNDRIATFDAASYQQSAFSMFGGRQATVTLRVKACAMSSIIDKFGKDVTSVPRSDGTCSVTVTVMASPVFYGWLTQFGSDIVIERPISERVAFKGYLREVIKEYDEQQRRMLSSEIS